MLRKHLLGVLERLIIFVIGRINVKEPLEARGAFPSSSHSFVFSFNDHPIIFYICLLWLQFNYGEKLSDIVKYGDLYTGYVVLRYPGKIYGAAYTRKFLEGKYITLDGYHSQHRPPLRPTLVLAKLAMALPKAEGKIIYCIFRKDRVIISMLMKYLGFNIANEFISNMVYVFKKES